MYIYVYKYSIHDYTWSVWVTVVALDGLGLSKILGLVLNDKFQKTVGNHQ